MSNWSSQPLQEGKCSYCGAIVLRYRLLAHLRCDACLKTLEKEKSRKWYLKHYQKRAQFRKENAAAISEYGVQYRADNHKEIIEKKREYNRRPEICARRRKQDAERCEELKQYKSEWHKAHPRTAEAKARWNEWRIRTGWSNKRHKERMADDVQYRLKYNLRCRLRSAIRGKFKSGSAIALLGCTGSEAVVYLESQFKPGMTWDNWDRHGWHVDHKKPLASFDLSDPEQLALACHYTNLQPMWAVENIRKGAKI